MTAEEMSYLEHVAQVRDRATNERIATMMESHREYHGLMANDLILFRDHVNGQLALIRTEIRELRIPRPEIGAGVPLGIGALGALIGSLVVYLLAHGVMGF